MKLECVGEPVSWLRLERFALGELPAEERSLVRDHLERCPACQACLEVIRAEPAPVLRPLPSPTPAPARRGFVWLGAAAAALASALLVMLLWPAAPTERGALPARMTVKGGELAVVLVRERGGAVQRDPGVFAPGDRFKALLTCPPPGEPAVELVVIQGGEVFFPLPLQRLACGNEVALPGAFSLDGDEEALVCLVVGDPLPRRSLARDALPASRTVCARLRPAAAD